MIKSSWIFITQESAGKTPEEEFAPSELVESPAVAKFKVMPSVQPGGQISILIRCFKGTLLSSPF